MYLRCLTSIELYLNCLYYCQHPLVEQQYEKGAFNCKGYCFATCLSDVAIGSLTKEDPSKAFLAVAYNNAFNHHYSSFLCMLSLSTVVGLPIESYYPIQNDSGSSLVGHAKVSLATMFNCTIFPREKN